MAEILSRTNAEALIQEQLVQSIWQDAPKQSVFMQLARKLPNMTSNQTRIRVLDVLPVAYWVDGDTGYKQTSKQAWDNVYLNAAELAVIVPIPEAVLADASVDLIGEVQPRITESIGKLVDQAIIFGINRPADWTGDIITRARQAGNNVAAGSGGAVTYDKLLGEGGVFSKVEEDGSLVRGCVASLGMRAKLRGIKDDNGSPLFKTDMQGPTQYALDGAPLYFPDNGSFDTSIAQLVVGDWSKAVYAVRQDITVKILDQGVIQNPTTKAIEYNLAQQDMIAIRVVFRMSWAMPNPATRLDEDRITCPFAYLEPATAAATYTLTFTVTDGATTPAAVSGAYVEVDGARIKTDASGKAVFNLRPGTWKYKVRKDGFVPVSGTKTVSSAAVAEAVTLTANA